MRTFSLVIALLLLGSSEGFAFECRGVRLPSSLVICSDAELMRLADERQEAFSQAMARLDGQQQKELLADQNGWVRSYATACGAPTGAAPTGPGAGHDQGMLQARGSSTNSVHHGIRVGRRFSAERRCNASHGSTRITGASRTGDGAQRYGRDVRRAPYGADPKLYKLYFDTLGKLANLSHDLFPNICRAKYKGDEKIRKALVDVGVTSYEIDHEDVAVIALKVLQEAEKFARSH